MIGNRAATRARRRPGSVPRRAGALRYAWAEGAGRFARITARAALVALALGAASAVGVSVPAMATRVSHRGVTIVRSTPTSCPWLRPPRDATPASLASEVVAKMSVREKLGLVDLRAVGGYENMNTGVPRLCIPPLTLQDSPNGISYGATGVTQLPASLGLAASFDAGLAYRYGEVEGAEAR